MALFAGWPTGALREPDLSHGGYLLLASATNLRERTFARLVKHLHTATLEFFTGVGGVYTIYPIEPTCSGFMHAVQVNGVAAGALSTIEISQPPRSSNADPELVPYLQDLAVLIAQDAEAAFKDDYFPGIPDITVPEDHVEVVMAAMQREMDREARSRTRTPVSFRSLPPERQRALAERRRFRYGQFGITPESWVTGRWSLWDVVEEMPDGLV